MKKIFNLSNTILFRKGKGKIIKRVDIRLGIDDKMYLNQVFFHNIFQLKFISNLQSLCWHVHI